MPTLHIKERWLETLMDKLTEQAQLAGRRAAQLEETEERVKRASDTVEMLGRELHEKREKKQ